jgi:hypothetical protein
LLHSCKHAITIYKRAEFVMSHTCRFSPCEAPCHLCMQLMYVIAALFFGPLCTCFIAKSVRSQHINIHDLPQSAAMHVHVPQAWRPPQELIDSYSSGIEAVLGYKFQKRALLQEALTHTSWPDATQQVRGCSFCHASHFCYCTHRQGAP